MDLIAFWPFVNQSDKVKNISQSCYLWKENTGEGIETESASGSTYFWGMNAGETS